jgi:hypothetical protein
LRRHISDVRSTMNSSNVGKWRSVMFPTNIVHHVKHVCILCNVCSGRLCALPRFLEYSSVNNVSQYNYHFVSLPLTKHFAANVVSCISSLSIHTCPEKTRPTFLQYKLYHNFKLKRPSAGVLLFQYIFARGKSRSIFCKNTPSTSYTARSFLLFDILFLLYIPIEL